MAARYAFYFHLKGMMFLITQIIMSKADEPTNTINLVIENEYVNVEEILNTLENIDYQVIQVIEDNSIQ